jgi:Protein of unknown function (DUF2628)
MVMTVFTVHEPPPGARDGKSWPDRIQFVRDGFYFWAFLLGPVWMLWRRMWLVFALFIVVTIAVQFALWLLEAPHQAGMIAGFLMALLIGFEAGSLRRWTLRKWRERGIVVAPNLEMAERRFFEMWPARQTAAETSPPPLPPGTHVPTSDADVIGLFPEPQPRQ